MHSLNLTHIVEVALLPLTRHFKPNTAKYIERQSFEVSSCILYAIKDRLVKSWIHWLLNDFIFCLLNR